MSDLGTLQDGLRSKATSINKNGLIVGSSTMTSSRSDHNYHATLWVDGDILDLNNLIDPALEWRLTFAADINENGQIVGEGFIDGARHGYILDPEWDAIVNTDQSYLTDSIILEDTFSFDFWWEMCMEPTEFNLDILGFIGGKWEVIGADFNFDGSSTGWETYTAYVPEWARGHETQIKFVVADLGQTTDPTV